MEAQTCAFLTLAGEKLPIEVDLNAYTGIWGFEKMPYLQSSPILDAAAPV